MSSSETVDLDAAEAWAFVEWEMSWHQQQPSHTWLDTMNRLIRKVEFLENMAGDKIHRDHLPTLTRDNLEVSRESWQLLQLVAARRDDVHLGTKSKCDRCPILIIRLSGASFILDGNHRTNNHILNEHQGPHDVVVISHIQA